MGEESYSSALKKIIKFSDARSAELAQATGYDISYISKWKSGCKLPSSRSVQNINTALGHLFASILDTSDKLKAFKDIFPLPVQADSTAAAITEYLNQSYRNSLRLKPGASGVSVPEANIAVGHLEVTTALRKILNHYLQTPSSSKEILIYGEFYDLHEAGFWNLFDDLPTTKALKIHVELDLNKAENDLSRIMAIYNTLNRHLSVDFHFYEIAKNANTHFILFGDFCTVQYDLNESSNFVIASIVRIDDNIQNISSKLSLLFPRSHELMSTASNPWNVDMGYRSSFYASSKFFFFLTNGIEYLLPHSVFTSISEQSSPVNKTYIEQLQIIWEEFLCKAELDVMIPLPSLIRYLENGQIDLTNVQYSLTNEERRHHIESMRIYAKNNPRISLGVLTTSDKAAGFKTANLSFYSNYDSAFFKKNAFLIDTDTSPFYIIKSERLRHCFFELFQSLKNSSAYHPYSDDIYGLHKPVIEKIIGTK